MMKKNEVLKVRVSEEELREIKTRADTEGMNTSTYVRCALGRDAQVRRLEGVIHIIEQSFGDMTRPASRDNSDPCLQEILLLCRELAGDRNPLLLMRVNARLKALRAGGDQS